MAYCKNCGGSVENNTKFCPNCGTALNYSSSTSSSNSNGSKTSDDDVSYFNSGNAYDNNVSTGAKVVRTAVGVGIAASLLHGLFRPRRRPAPPPPPMGPPPMGPRHHGPRPPMGGGPGMHGGPRRPGRRGF